MKNKKRKSTDEKIAIIKEGEDKGWVETIPKMLMKQGFRQSFCNIGGAD